MNVVFSNPKAVKDAVTEAVCTLDIIDVDDPPSWNRKSYRMRFTVIEECASEIGKCIDNGNVFAIDEDNHARNIEYSANDRFFSVATDRNRFNLPVFLIISSGFILLQSLVYLLSSLVMLFVTGA